MDICGTGPLRAGAEDGDMGPDGVDVRDAELLEAWVPFVPLVMPPPAFPTAAGFFAHMFGAAAGGPLGAPNAGKSSSDCMLMPAFLLGCSAAFCFPAALADIGCDGEGAAAASSVGAS